MDIILMNTCSPIFQKKKIALRQNMQNKGNKNWKPRNRAIFLESCQIYSSQRSQTLFQTRAAWGSSREPLITHGWITRIPMVIFLIRNSSATCHVASPLHDIRHPSAVSRLIWLNFWPRWDLGMTTSKVQKICVVHSMKSVNLETFRDLARMSSILPLSKLDPRRGEDLNHLGEKPTHVPKLCKCSNRPRNGTLGSRRRVRWLENRNGDGNHILVECNSWNKFLKVQDKKESLNTKCRKPSFINQKYLGGDKNGSVDCCEVLPAPKLLVAFAETPFQTGPKSCLQSTIEMIETHDSNVSVVSFSSPFTLELWRLYYRSLKPRFTLQSLHGRLIESIIEPLRTKTTLL